MSKLKRCSLHDSPIIWFTKITFGHWSGIPCLKLIKFSLNESETAEGKFREKLCHNTKMEKSNVFDSRKTKQCFRSGFSLTFSSGLSHSYLYALHAHCFRWTKKRARGLVFVCQVKNWVNYFSLNWLLVHQWQWWLFKTQYLSYVTRSVHEMAALLGQNQKSLTVWRTRFTQTPIYLLPFIHKEDSFKVEDTLLRTEGCTRIAARVHTWNDLERLVLKLGGFE